MSVRIPDTGIITDEVAPDLAEALETAMGWGLRRFELREGRTGRFPAFTREEVAAVEAARQAGACVTAVSPGLLKGAVDDTARLRRELDDVLPRALERAQRFACPVLILFGFARYEGEPDGNRTRAMRAFEQAAERATEAGMVVALENEPRFWIDHPAGAAAMLEEIGHPALGLNWDPANLHWGGHVPTYDDFLAARPCLVNVHVKDYYPARPEAPWMPVGEGTTPWDEILPWLVYETDLAHVTIETHCAPQKECSMRSLENLRRLIEAAHIRGVKQ